MIDFTKAFLLSIVICCFTGFFSTAVGQSDPCIDLTLEDCMIDFAGFMDLMPTSGDTIPCANDPIFLPELCFDPGAGAADPGIVWGVYLDQPTSTNPNMDPNNTFVALSNADGIIYNSGTADFSLAGFLGAIDTFTFCIVPIIDDDISSGVVDDDCNGVDLSFTYPCYTIVDTVQQSCSSSIDLPLASGTVIHGPYNNICVANDTLPPIPETYCFFGDDPYQQILWFNIEGNGGMYSINTLNCEGTGAEQLEDTQIAIYSGACNELVYVDCNDDNNGVLAGIDNFQTVAGVEYIIIVDGFDTEIGEFCIEIEEVMPPPLCDAESGETMVNTETPDCETTAVTATVTGDNTSGFTTVILLSQGGVIVDNSIVSGAPFSNVPGVYEICAFNYADEDAAFVAPLLEVGEDKANIATAIADGLCGDVGDPIEVTISEGSTADNGTTTLSITTEACEGDEVTATVSGDNTDGFSTVFVLVNDDNILQSAVAPMLILDLPAGNYTLCTVNFSDGDAATVTALTEVGDSKADLQNAITDGTVCGDASDPINFTILPTDDPSNDCFDCLASTGTVTYPTELIVCEGETSETITVSGAATGDYTTTFVLVGDGGAGAILTSNTTGAFSFEDNELGFYKVYVVNYHSFFEDDVNAFINMGMTWDAFVATLSGMEICHAIDEGCVVFEYSLCFDCEADFGDLVPTSEQIVCVGDIISMEAFGANADGYSTLYLLTNDVENIIISTTDGIFTPPVGNFTIHAINYLDEDEATVLAATTISELEGLIDDETICADLDVMGLSFTVQSEEDCFDCEANVGTVITVTESFTVCAGMSIEITVTGEATAPYQTLYLLTDADAGAIHILDYSLTAGSFNPGPGSYFIYALNYLDISQADIEDFITSVPPPLLTLSEFATFLDIENICADLSTGEFFTVLPEDDPACTDVCLADYGSVLPTDTMICAGKIVTFTTVGENSDPDFATIFAVTTDPSQTFTGEILTGGNFSSATAGVFQIHAINYEAVDEAAIQAIITSSGTMAALLALEACFDVDDAGVTVTVLPEDDIFCVACIPSVGMLTAAEDTVVCENSLSDLIIQTGANEDGYTTVWVITDYDTGVVVGSGNTNPVNFDGIAPGGYLVYGINIFDGQLGALDNEIGNAIDMGLNILDLFDNIADLCEHHDSDAVPFLVIPEGDPDCEDCEADYGNVSVDVVTACFGETVTVTTDGASTEGFGSAYIIISNMMLVEFSFDGILDDLAPGVYQVHAINYASDDSTDIFDILAANMGATDPLFDTEFCFDVDIAGFEITILEADDIACLDPLMVDDLEENEALDMLTYTIMFTISGGSGNYLVEGNPIVGSVFTSDTIPCGTPYSFSVTDDVGNGPIVVTGTSPCPKVCTTESGIMPDLGGSVMVCDGDEISVMTFGESLEGGHVLVYVLHTGEDEMLGTIVATNTESGTFNSNSSPLIEANVQYFVSAVAGPNDGTGLPIYDDECTDVASGTPVVFLDPIVIDYDDDCDKNTGTYTINFSITGGLPAFNSDFTYTVTGDFLGLVSIGENQSTGAIAGGDGFTLNATDGSMCSATVGENSLFCLKTPIELLRFEGEVQQAGNLLAWATASETDNDYFALERSTDGYSFETIGYIDGAGNSTSLLTYEFLDQKAPVGLAYYRLTQSDYDGNTTTSNTISLKRTSSEFGINSVYPIPADRFIEMSYTADLEGQVTVQIFDIMGRLLVKQNLQAGIGLNLYHYDISDFSAGIYLISLSSGERVENMRFVAK